MSLRPAPGSPAPVCARLPLPTEPWSRSAGIPPPPPSSPAGGRLQRRSLPAGHGCRKIVSATFNLAQVRNKTSGANYATLADALSTAGAGNELLMLGMQYNGATSLNAGVTLSGGWDTTYAARSGTPSALNDGLSVLAGDSKADTVTVKGGISVKGGSLRVKDV